MKDWAAASLFESLRQPVLFYPFVCANKRIYNRFLCMCFQRREPRDVLLKSFFRRKLIPPLRRDGKSPPARRPIKHPFFHMSGEAERMWTQPP